MLSVEGWEGCGFGFDMGFGNGGGLGGTPPGVLPHPFGKYSFFHGTITPGRLFGADELETKYIT